MAADLGAPGTAIAAGALQLPGSHGCSDIRLSCVPSCPCNTKKMQLLNRNIFWAAYQLQQVCKLLAQQGLLTSSAVMREENMQPVGQLEQTLQLLHWPAHRRCCALRPPCPQLPNASVCGLCEVVCSTRLPTTAAAPVDMAVCL